MTLENTLKKLTGIDIEITVTSEKSFAFTFEGQNLVAEKKIISYFKNKGVISSEYDELCETTCIWLKLT